MITIPCICGHDESAHFTYGSCSHIDFPFSAKRHHCGCAKFVRYSNLEWLEIQYDKKH